MIQAALEKAPGAPKGWWGHLFPEPGSLETKQNHPRFPWHISMGRTLCSLLTDEMRFLLFSQNWLLMATAHLKPFDFFFFCIPEIGAPISWDFDRLGMPL